MPYLHIPFRCEVLTPERKAFAGEVLSAVFPAVDGYMGVLSGRSPMMALLGGGRFIVRQRGGGRQEFYVGAGFARFGQNVLSLLVEECLPVEAIDPEHAWQEILAADKLPRQTPQEEAYRDQVLQAARARFSMAQRHRKATGQV